MAARKDDGQEPPAGGRQTVIWRLPATASAEESTDAPDAPDTEADRSGDRPRGRRVPLPVVWGLAAALVCVGLYAAWSEFGSELLSAGGEGETATASAPAASSAAQTGAGTAGGAESAPPPAAGEGTPLAAAEEGTGEGAQAGDESGTRGRGAGSCRRSAGRRARADGDSDS